MFKKLIIIIMTLSLLLSILGVTTVSAAEPYFVKFYDSTKETSPQYCMNSDTFGIHFNATSAFNAVKLFTPTWGGTEGGLTIELYKWTKTYQDSLETPVLRTKTIEKIKDGSKPEFEFDEIAAGEYLLFVKYYGPKDKGMGVYCYKSTFDHQVTYRNGNILANMAASLEVKYINEVANKYGALSPIPNFETVKFHDGTGNQPGGNPVQIANDGSFAIQFHTTSKFDRVSVRCPSWGNNIGNLTFSIYKWSYNYANTIKGKALNSHEFVNYTDNIWLSYGFNDLDAGEYLLVITNTSSAEDAGVGLWTVKDSTFNKAKYYMNGESVNNAGTLEVRYAQTVSEKYGAISAETEAPTPAPTTAPTTEPATNPQTNDSVTILPFIFIAIVSIIFVISFKKKLSNI